MLGIPNPKVGILSIGEEEGKGNALTKDAYAARRLFPQFHRQRRRQDVFQGETDVIVCDGFVGNVALKLSEGLGSALASMLKTELKSIWSHARHHRLPAFKRFGKKIDYAEYGEPHPGPQRHRHRLPPEINARAIHRAAASRYFVEKANDQLVEGLHANTELSLFSGPRPPPRGRKPRRSAPAVTQLPGNVGILMSSPCFITGLGCTCPGHS
ncbi:hypothetical protein MASR2M17_23650 [Aminivibrio sp.]